MATMNKTKSATKTPVKDTHTTRNHEGAKVHALNALEVLFSKVLGSLFGESTYYEKGKNALSDYKDLAKTLAAVADEDKEYALKIAVLGREYDMIQYPLALLTACFNDDRFKGENFTGVKGTNKLQYYANRIIRRARDIVDILAMQITVYGFDKSISRAKGRVRPLPIQLRKALKRKLESFNDYQISKGLSESKDVTMADAIKLLHPNESVARVPRGFFKRIIEGDVEFGAGVSQIQVESKRAATTATARKERQEKVAESIDTSSMLALLKNLMAIYRQGAFDNEKIVADICARFTDPEQVRKSHILPYRFYSAYDEISKLTHKGTNIRRILDALTIALDISAVSTDKIEGYTAVVIDCSGSMDGSAVSAQSSISARDLAIVLGAICAKQSIGDVYCFGDSAAQVIDVSSTSTVMDIIRQINIVSQKVGRATYLNKAFDLIERKYPTVKYDNVVILSDNDCYTSDGKTFMIQNAGSNRYNERSLDDRVNTLIRSGVVKKLYLNNLLGNSYSIVNTEDYRKNLITGFSEKYVDVINVYSAIGSSARDIRKVIDYLFEKVTYADRRPAARADEDVLSPAT